MTSGGRFPRWRWRRVKYFAAVWTVRKRPGGIGATVGLLESGLWHASFAARHSREFHRRCDAKRWCEWMLDVSRRKM